MTRGQRLGWLIGVLVPGLLQPAFSQTQITEPPASPSGPEAAPLQPDPSLTPTPLPPPDSDAAVPAPNAAAASTTQDPDDWDLPRPPAPVPPPAPPVAAAPTDSDEMLPPAPAPPAPITPLPPEPAEASPPTPMAPPAAYSVPPAGVTRSPSLIAQCLCAQRQTSALHRQAERAQRSYVDGKARLATLDNQLAQTKSTVDSNDPAQVDAYRRLLLQSEQQNAHLYNDVLPETQSIVGRYNQAVDNYNARCSGQRFDSAVLAQVSASLVCQ